MPHTKEKWEEANDGMMAIFSEFAACRASGASADSDEARALVAKLQAHITENYYTCTDEILAGLGKMYVAQEEHRQVLRGKGYVCGRCDCRLHEEHLNKSPKAERNRGRRNL